MAEIMANHALLLHLAMLQTATIDSTRGFLVSLCAGCYAR
jgi:hypothetical protein